MEENILGNWTTVSTFTGGKETKLTTGWSDFIFYPNGELKVILNDHNITYADNTKHSWRFNSDENRFEILFENRLQYYINDLKEDSLLLFQDNNTVAIFCKRKESMAK